MRNLLREADRFWRCGNGASAIEFAIVCLPLVLLSVGVFEFGRALNTRNDLSYAADFAARRVLMGETSDGALKEAVQTAFTGRRKDLMEVSIGSETVNGIQFRTVTLRYPFSPMIPGFAGHKINLSLSRRVPAP